jgi:hypothetical protein
MNEWRSRLKVDSLPWLLEPENPSVRYWTLVDLLDRPVDDPEVHEARAAIPTWPPVAELLAAQKPDGYWIQRDYYLPKCTGTFWVLSFLADLGLTNENEHVRKGCDFLFAHQREDGGFCRRRQIQGQGIVWEAQPDACTHARIARFLIQFGYGDDGSTEFAEVPRTQAALDRLLATQRDDGMWLCDRAGRHGCLRATLNVLRAAILDPKAAAHPAIARAAAIVCDLLMEPKMGRYHVDDQWTVLEYPHVGYGVIPALDALARLGYTLEHPKVAAATAFLLSRQLLDGVWPLDRSPRRLPLGFGQPGQPNKWVTLDALRVLKTVVREG